MMSATSSEFHCLLVEDDDDHAYLTTRALRRCGADIVIERAGDGERALAHLRDLMSRSARMPDLILLDLNLPRVPGHDVLRHIKQDPAMRGAPVVVLTTSEAADDRRKAYDHHANGYIAKPVEADGFDRLAAALINFWRLWNRPSPRAAEHCGAPAYPDN